MNRRNRAAEAGPEPGQAFRVSLFWSGCGPEDPDSNPSGSVPLLLLLHPPALGPSRCWRRLPLAVALEALVQGAAGDAQALGGAGDVAVLLTQDPLDVAAFQLGQGDVAIAGERGRAGWAFEAQVGAGQV